MPFDRPARLALALPCFLLLACSSFSAAEPGDPDAGSGGGSGDGAPVADGGRSGLDGAPGNPPPLPEGVLANGYTNLRDIATDGDVVYFTERMQGLVHSVPASGGPVSTSPGQVNTSPVGLAVANAAAYWASEGSSRIYWIKAGAPMESSVALAAKPFAIAAASSGLVTLVHGPNGPLLELRSYAAPGAVTKLLGTVDAAEDLAVVDDDVWILQTAVNKISHVVAKDGSSTNPVTEQDPPRAVAAGPLGVAWITDVGDVRYQSSAAGGGAIGLSKEAARPVAIAVDDVAVYWITDDGALRRWVPVDGSAGTITELVKGFMPSRTPKTHSLAVANKNVVWLTGDGNVLVHAR